MKTLLTNIHIILVEPVYAGNVGAVARIMHNFSLENLRIVGHIPEKNDYIMAVHSNHILDQALIFDDLASSVADMDRVIALSRRVGKTKPIDMRPRQTAAYVNGLPGLQIGLVFGRETYGLTDVEADLCPLRCHIPSNPDFPSLNLAQAVAVMAWELYSERIENSTKTKAPKDVAGGKELDTVKRYMIEVMRDVGFFRSYEPTNWSSFLDKMFSQLNPGRETLYRFRQMFNRFHVLITGRGKGYELREGFEAETLSNDKGDADGE